MSSWRTIGTFNVDLFDQDYIVKGLQQKTIAKFGNHWGKKQGNFVWGNINQFRLTSQDHFVLGLIV
jgi:hypothetical protein